MIKAKQSKTKGVQMIKEILRLKESGLGTRKIAEVLGISRNTVKSYLDELSKKSLSQIVDEKSLVYQAQWSTLVNWDSVKRATNLGKSLSVYWEELICTSTSLDLSSVSYVSFWREFKRRYPEIPIDFHKIHPPAERCEIDYKGKDAIFGYTDKHTSEFVQCHLFGAILCFSQLFYARATHAEKQDDWYTSIAKSYEYFGGVPYTTAFDNAKACVNKANKYDPDINKEFSRLCEHFNTVPLAMRPRQPKDKNLIENALGVFWRWAYYDLSTRKFFSIGDLNRFLHEKVNELNNRIQKKYGLSRKQKYEQGEKEKLLPLPLNSYSFGTWKPYIVHADSHIQVQYCFYSVPFSLRKQTVDVRVSENKIEVFYKLELVAYHIKSSVKGRYVTCQNHLPPAHQAMNEATPQYVLNESKRIGDATHLIIENLLVKQDSPLRYLRRTLGILRLSKRYTKEKLESACAKLIELNIFDPRLDDIERIIKANVEINSETTVVRQPNPNLRGQTHWSTTKH